MSAVEAAAGKAQAMVRDSVKTVIAASMVGTAIEFYDFYAYGTAAANYFPKVFFGDTTNPTVALLASLLTFAIAFIARPLGSLVFGHFGDRMGRKTTLVVSLLTMGIATFLIGCLPTYSQWGIVAVAALCLCRFVQGIGLGGEWSGAALVATGTLRKTSARCMAPSRNWALRSVSSCRTVPTSCWKRSTMTMRCWHGAGVYRSCCPQCW